MPRNVIKIKPFKEPGKEGLKVELGFNRNLKCDDIMINCNTNKWIRFEKKNNNKAKLIENNI